MNPFLVWRTTVLFALSAGVVAPAMAAPLQLVSAIDSSSTPPTSGGGDSWNPIISPDGRFILFASTANNLTLTTSNSPFLAQVPPNLNVFLRDRTNGITTLVSVNLTGTGGGNGDSIPTGLSTNGQFVLFESSASDLVPGDTNNVMDVFVRDLVNGTTLLASVTTNGGCANGPSGQSVMTADGRFVAFSSAATNLVAGDTNRIPDIYVRDLQAGTTVLASPGATAGSTLPASSDSPQITPDGRYVAFLSTAIKLVPGVTTANEVYVRDLESGTTFFASTNAHKAIPFNSISYNHVISDDGQYVAYEAGAIDGTAGFIFRYNLQTASTVGVHSNAVIATGGYKHFRSLDMTPDGRFITFIGKAGTSGRCIYAWDGQTASITPVTTDTNNVAVTNQLCDWPILDTTGQFVAFLSTATNLTTNVVAGDFHLYVRDLQGGTTRLIDAGTNGAASAKDWLNAPCLSAGGRFVAFDCTDADLVPNDNNQAYDVFVCDLSTETTELISARHPAVPSQTPNGPSSAPVFSMSADGRYVALASTAGNLVANCTNSYRGVFVRDLLVGTNLLVSADTNGLAGADGPSTDPAISADGRFVAFTSSADNLVPADTNLAPDVFLRDLLTGTTTLVSVNTGGIGPGNAASYSPALSADGRYVLFRSSANNLAPAAAGGLFWRDLQGGQTRVVTASLSSPAAITSDGRFVAYGGASANLYVWDSQSATSIYTNTTPAISTVAISPDGNRVAGLRGSELYAADRTAQTNWLIVTGPTGSLSHAGLQFSSDGRFLAYTTAAALASGDTNGASDVYLYDFQTQSNLLVSQSCGWSGAANGPSDSPGISTDGRFVAYRSLASDLVPGDTNAVPDVFLYDRLTSATTLLSVSAFGDSAANNRSGSPAFSGDGQVLVFQSWAADLITQDFNQGADLFALKLAAANPISVFRGQIVFAPATGRSPTLTWPVVPGNNYGVQFKDNLDDPIWRNLNGSVSLVGDRGYATDKAPSPSYRFYRIVAF